MKRDSMKIAVLMLVHKNKIQFERLVSKLQHDNIDVFVHLDKKANWEPDEVNFSGVTFTEKRYDVSLFDFSMVNAEKELIATAKKHGDYNYFILMSGQCYPIVRIDEIYNYLCTHYPEPMIEIVAPKEDNYVKVNFEHVYILKRFKLKTYAFLKKHFSYKGYRILRYIPGGFTLLVSTIKEIFVASPKKRLKKRNQPMYCGSQWWILPDKVMDNVLPFFDDEEYCKIVSDTFSCDETFFQTAIMAHQDKNGIKTDADGNFMNRRWFYIFDGGHPILLNSDYLHQITNSGMLFARKFDTDFDDKILDQIDQKNS